MPPDAYRKPASCLEPCVSIGVATSVTLDLLSPPEGILLWPSRMLRASVPKAAVHEDSYPCRSKHDVGPPLQPGDWTPLDTEP
jgi:hypothetical protein